MNYKNKGCEVRLALAAAALLFASCAAQNPPAPKKVPAERVTTDHHSFSRPDLVRVTHADLDWTVDFDAQQLRGSVTWTVERAPGSEDEPLILDTKGLTIESVFSGKGQPVAFEFGTADEILGAPLLINMAPGDRTVTIAYRTGPDAAALQWLAPEQTAGKKHPYLYSHSFPINARTLWPCQDSPAVRFTYEAAVTVPADLKAVMAAQMLPDGGSDKPFRFRMPQPVPSYLVAFAVGDIVHRKLGPRTGVYAEPSVVDAAAFEFADTEALLESTEQLYGPYRWDRYDLLVMPPSFPLGGMENPRLNFVSPTMIAGDRSRVSVVAHELAHSWSGNLVTNASWSDFWLNEGTTVYVERRVLEDVFGKALADMEAVNWLDLLREEIPTLDEGLTALHVVSLAGRDPLDNFTGVPYDKGYLFLRVLEEAVGRKNFDGFLRAWFDQNAFQSRTTMDFEKALDEHLFDGDKTRVEALRVEEWLYGTGLPENYPVASSDKLERARVDALEFAKGNKTPRELPGQEWTPHEWIRVIRTLPEDVATSKLAELDDAWSVSDTGNFAILIEWLLVSIRSGYEGADQALEKVLNGGGPSWSLGRLYTELAETPEGRERALDIYSKARPLYHEATVYEVEKVLGPGS